MSVRSDGARPSRVKVMIGEQVGVQLFGRIEKVSSKFQSSSPTTMQTSFSHHEKGRVLLQLSLT